MPQHRATDRPRPLAGCDRPRHAHAWVSPPAHLLVGRRPSMRGHTARRVFVVSVALIVLLTLGPLGGIAGVSPLNRPSPPPAAPVDVDVTGGDARASAGRPSPTGQR